MTRPILKFLPFLLLLVLAPLLLPAGRLGSYYLTLMILSLSYSVAALGLTVLLGYSGQISLAQAAFFGIGAYTFSLLAVNLHVDFWLSTLAALVVTTGFGLILGAISLRLASHYLALVTIGFQIITGLVLNNWTAVTGGANGVGNIPRPDILGVSLNGDLSFYWFSVATLTLAAYLVYRLRHSRLGWALLALREDEIAAAANGISVFWTKILAFASSAFLAAMGGVLFASGALYISPDVFNFYQSVSFFAMTLVGGQDSIVGTTLGAWLITFLPEVLRFLHAYYIAVYGLMVVIVVLFMPEGLYGLLLRGVDMFRRRVLGQGERRDPEARPLSKDASLKRPVATDTPLLEIDGLAKHFGGIKAVDGVSLTVNRGDVAVLIGPNGSGKTTVLNVLSGIYSATRGSIRFKGREITNLASNRINRLGISRTFQNIRLFPEMTALENVAVGCYKTGTVGLTGTLLSLPKGYREEAAAIEKARETLQLLGFERPDVKAKNLPYGQQRVVEIARAIVSEPALLLLDEPAAGMNHEETQVLSQILYRIHSLGVTMLLIEHDMSFVSSVATQAYVMDFGTKISEGSVNHVLADPAVMKAYLGDEVDYA